MLPPGILPRSLAWIEIGRSEGGVITPLFLLPAPLGAHTYYTHTQIPWSKLFLFFFLVHGFSACFRSFLVFVFGIAVVGRVFRCVGKIVNPVVCRYVFDAH